MFESSTIEISQSALNHNLKFIKKKLKKGVRLCSVVKGNAYGHGLAQYVQMAMDLGVDYFAVHSADEAFQLCTSLKKIPDLFIMGAMEDQAIEWAIKNEIEFAVFDLGRLNRVIECSKKLKIPAKIHVEMETGMRRTGFEFSDLNFLIGFLKENLSYVTLQGLFSHLAGAESRANDFRVAKQIETFDKAFQSFKAAGVHPRYFHLACSAALLNYPETQGNMVRIGILQYGFWPNSETHIRYCGDSKSTPDLLKRVIRWTVKVMAIKRVKRGSYIGYGTSYLAHKDMILAILPIGYSHGYARNLSNVGSVLINGKNAPVVGVVNMNSLTVDITNCGTVVAGDEVVLIGKQKGKAITVNSFSEQIKLLNYEFLVRLPASIPRIIGK